MATNLPHQAVEKDAQVWLDDGNVVVVAQNTAFRVHKSLLSRHSDVFRDLFTIPQPPVSGGVFDLYDNCPVVHVSDTSFDFRELLRVIYGGVSYFNPDNVAEFSVLAAIARLSHKYELDELLEATVRRLKQTFTSRFDVWARNDGFERSPFSVSLSNAIEALNLFHTLGRLEMLPTALYQCCQLDPHYLVFGAPRADGTPESLGPEDLERCLRAQNALSHEDILVALAPSAQPAAACGNPHACRKWMRALFLAVRNDPPPWLRGDPLSSFFVTVTNTSLQQGRLCTLCGEKLVAGVREHQRGVWVNLPANLGMREVEGWNEDEA